MELKTSMSIRGPEDEARFEKYVLVMVTGALSDNFISRKLLKFYMQSFLLGVPVRIQKPEIMA